MPRVARQCPGGYVYHVWNRAAGRLRLFKKDADYLAFERVLLEAHRRHPLKLLDWCLMPNHWHFVVWPNKDRQVTAFFRWLTHTHAMRSIAHRRVMGTGPLYQGRFKSLPVQDDGHLLTLLRYVQRNPVRAKLVHHAAQWRWASQAVRVQQIKELKAILADWPFPRPRDWPQLVDQPLADQQTTHIRQCIRRNRPLGNPAWTTRTADRLKLDWTLRPRGRPSKQNREEQRKELRPL
jgi:putative transposase